MKYFGTMVATALIATTFTPEVEANQDILQITKFWTDRNTYYPQPVFWLALINALQDTTDQSGGDT